MKGKLFKRVTALLSTAAMLLTYADFSAIDFSVHAENGDEPPQLADFDLNGNGIIDDGEKDWGYALDSADELLWFADMVHNDNEHYGSANAFLAEDITVNENLLTYLITVDEDGTAKLINEENKPRVWTPIGTYTSDYVNSPYSGTFDGNNKTISGLYFNYNDNDNGADNVGLFGYVGTGGKIQDVTIADSYMYGKTKVGGICGNNEGTISNCYNTGTVNGKYDVGGVCGYIENGTIEKCYNTGTVNGKYDVGGVCGYAYNDANVKECSNAGKVESEEDVGGVCGGNFQSEISNCYNTGDVTGTGNCVGGVCGGNTGTITNCYYLNTVAEDLYATAMTAQQFASGEVCWLLNVGQSDNPVFYQNIGKDISPVLDKHHTVIKNGESYKNNAHSYENGFCTVCGYEPADAVKDEEDIDSDGDKEETVYEISNAGQLYWFADKVHNDNATYGSANAFLAEDITVNENLLTELITVDEDGTATLKSEEEPTVWTPIGDYTFQYSGIFNGNNKTISGLYFNNIGVDYVGLFGYVGTGGKIQDVTIADSYMYGKTKVGGICGYNSSGSIENCYNTGDVSGNMWVGGVCGGNTGGSILNCYNTGDVSGTGRYVGGVCGGNNGTISNCYNTGDVSGNMYVGGVCGSNSNDGSISNCYNTGAVEGTSGVCGSNTGSISNCYYLDTTAENGIGNSTDAINGPVTAKSAEQFASGEVCWLLNGEKSDNPVFYQNIGKDISPVFDSTHHAVKHSETSYYNEHTDFDEEGFCTVCGNGYQPATTVKDVNDIDGDGHTDDDVYEISNAGQLYWFAGLVNGTLGGVERIRSANAVLTADITVNEKLLTDFINVSDEDGTAKLINEENKPRVWTPIGNISSKYSGAFDGEGHTVSGLYFNDSGATYVGLFGFVSNGESENKIMNLTVSDSYFCGDEKVGGVCGLNKLVTIQNCSNTGTVRGNSYVGGVCGYISKRVIENCYNTGKVSGNSYIGGICGYNDEKNTIQNCYNTGAVTGTENVGGICGRASYYGQPTIMIKNCYNKGAVSGTENVGSICGAGDRVIIEKCYYLKTEGVRGRGTGDDKPGSTEVKSAEQFASGEVCWLLNGGKTQAEPPVFFQNIDKEAFPVLDSKHHTVVEKDGAYLNEHNFESEICTICGAFEDGMGAKLAGHSLTLDGSIGVNFYMVLDESVAEDENAYMRFTLPNGKTENVKVSQAEKKTVNGMECYVFKCNVAAKEMTATIKAQMFSNGKQGTVYEYTVKEYADYLFANAYEDGSTTVKNQEYAKAYALVEAMVNYGAYSQIYFDYNTNALANAGRTDKVNEVTAEKVNKPYDKTKNNLPEGVSLVSANLELESETVLNLLFTNTTDNELKFKTSDDVTLTQTKSGDYTKVTITNIAAQHLSEDIIVNISVDGDTASYSATYSPMNYCYSVLSKETTETRTDELKNVMRAFWLYNQQAKAYFQNN